MTLARANSTSEARERWRSRIKDPSYVPPRVELKHKKEPGSKSLILGRWVEEGDADASL
jgi:hypothetical protein